MADVIEKRGLFSSFHSDRGSHYWTTPEAGGKVDKKNLTQFGRALKPLGIEMIARSQRPFGARLWHASGAFAASVSARGHYDDGGGQPLPSGGVSTRVQR